jgi:predicted site-specific integrase-resolvase
METRDSQPEGLLTPALTGQVLGISPQTLARWRVEGKGPPFVKLGGRVAYRQATLQSWIEGREKQSTSSVPRPVGSQ